MNKRSIRLFVFLHRIARVSTLYGHSTGKPQGCEIRFQTLGKTIRQPQKLGQPRCQDDAHGDCLPVRDRLGGILLDGVRESVSKIEQATLPALIRIPSGNACLYIRRAAITLGMSVNIPGWRPLAEPSDAWA